MTTQPSIGENLLTLDFHFYTGLLFLTERVHCTMALQAATGLSEHSHHLNVIFVAVTGLMTLLSTCLVALRFISRSLTLSIKLDDWFCLLALIFSYGLLCTTALVTTVGHAGIHIAQYKDPLVLERYFQVRT